MLQPPEEHDPNSQLHLEREWRFERNSKVRREAAKQQAKTGNRQAKQVTNKLKQAITKLKQVFNKLKQQSTLPNINTTLLK